MRNILKKTVVASLQVCMLASLVACSDEFIDEKRNYDNVSADMYNFYSGARARVDDIYTWCLPDIAQSGASWNSPSTGKSDDLSKSTEEYSGFGKYVDPERPMTSIDVNPVPDYYDNENKVQQAVWGRIRNINDVIRGIENSTGLTAAQKDELMGQVLFFRAWCYYSMVKWYGGVPIVREVLEPTEETTVPRATTRECIQFMCEDLDNAVRMLTASTVNGRGWGDEDWGRVTAGAAAALKGRVLLLWASPIFNRANDKSRWEEAYSYIKNSLNIINQCGHGLDGESNPGVNASTWAGMFSKLRSPESIFQTNYNTIASGGSPDTHKNNNWEQYIRPKNAGGGGATPSAMLVDLFPMKDGKLPNVTAENRAKYSVAKQYNSLDESSIEYDPAYPFVDRDPRFYRTFAFPGVRWAYSGNALDASSDNPSYDGGTNYVLWNYVWYDSPEKRDDIEQSGFGADNLLTNVKGMYVRKRSDDNDINSPLYVYDGKVSAFQRSAAPYMEIRYAEVLLNLAEAAAMSNHLQDAKDQLVRIRQRVGYTGDCGLEGITASQQKCVAAILYERQIELAYEGKRFDDMRRWLLFDGGADFSSISGCPASWKLTGWGGNTCTWLGVKPLNGQRRENMEFRVSNDFNNGIGGTTKDSDPLVADFPRDMWSEYAPLDLRTDISAMQLKLKEFYEACFVRKTKKGDSYTSNHEPLYIKHQPYYYFLGLYKRALNEDPNVIQTIGWQTLSGANGTYDPLAE